MSSRLAQSLQAARAQTGIARRPGSKKRLRASVPKVAHVATHPPDAQFSSHVGVVEPGSCREGTRALGSTFYCQQVDVLCCVIMHSQALFGLAAASFTADSLFFISAGHTRSVTWLLACMTRVRQRWSGQQGPAAKQPWIGRALTLVGDYVAGSGAVTGCNLS